MRRAGLLILILLLVGVPVAAQRGRMTPPAGTIELAYGDQPRQRLDFTRVAGRRAPLVLFIHGGAWRFGDKRIAGHMAAHFHARGAAFAAINYRFVPQVSVDEQAADVAASLARLIRDARRLEIDADRIILIGHSAGAHLAALVGSDPRYLAAHRLPMTAIDGIVLLDGAGYDVPRQMAAAGPFLRRLYVGAFGADPDFQRRVSPVFHAAAPNAGRFLILHIASRPDESGIQSERLGAALRAAGTPTEVEAVPGNHSGIFRRFGSADHRATLLTDAFAGEIFGSIGR